MLEYEDILYSVYKEQLYLGIKKNSSCLGIKAIVSDEAYTPESNYCNLGTLPLVMLV